MTWEEKLHVLNAISKDPCFLIMRRPGNWYLRMSSLNWYVHPDMDHAPTPEAAVEQAYAWATGRLAGLEKV